MRMTRSTEQQWIDHMAWITEFAAVYLAGLPVEAGEIHTERALAADRGEMPLETFLRVAVPRLEFLKARLERIMDHRGRLPIIRWVNDEPYFLDTEAENES